MSTAESDVLTVRRDGVSVEKSFEPDEFPVPAIAFVVRSERDEPVSLRLFDVLPDDVNASNVGFHPQYGEEFWSVEEGRIVFEREFDPEEEYTTVYAVRDSDLDDIERFLVEPEIDDVDPALSVVGDSSQVVRDVISGEGSVPGLDEDEDEGEEEDEVEPLTLKDPSGEGTAGRENAVSSVNGADGPQDGEGGEDSDEATAGGVGELDALDETGVGDRPADGDGDGDESAAEAEDSTTDYSADEAAHGVDEAEPDAAGAGSAVAAGGVAAALVEELEAGQVDDETRAALADQLGVDDGPDGSVDARLSQLQTDIADLRAYTNALEEFLDENGEAQTLLSELKGRIDGVEGTIDEIEQRSTENEETLNSMSGRVGELSGRVNDLGDDVDDARETVASLSEQAVTDDDLAALDDRLDDIEERLGDAEAIDDRLAGVESDIDDVHDTMDDFAAFRQRVQAVFGGEDV